MTDDLDAKTVELWQEGEHMGNNNNNNNCRLRLDGKGVEAVTDYLKYRFAGGRVYVSGGPRRGSH